MNVKYNMVVNTVNAALKVYAHCLPKNVKHKFPEFVKGRVGLIRKIMAEMANDDTDTPLVWFHASSLGEYAIARPLIAQLKASGRNVRIVVTFFSPSGYRALHNNHPGVDHVFYFPLDTLRNARGFLEAVKPTVAVFLVSEYWPNILQELKFRAIPTFLVSAIIRDDSPFFRRYGKIFRKSLSSYKHFFVLDENSRMNLRSLGCDNVTLSGDPLFDNAALVASTPWSDPVLDRFTADGSQVFMAGSVSDGRDLALVCNALKENPQMKSIVVPHDISHRNIQQIADALGPATALYSELTPSSELSRVRHIVVDCMGLLAYMYRYATMAYVGGGFTPLLHSVIEATVYGIPVSFGPRTERKVTPRQLIDLGIGTMVKTPAELALWAASFTPDQLSEIKETALRFVDENIGATRNIVKTIEKEIWPSN